MEGQLPRIFGRAPTTAKTSKPAASGILVFAAGAIVMTLWSCPLTAADVTFERLKNAESEPGNWLTNHKTYDAKRY